MLPRLIETTYVRRYVIHVRFSDGIEGEVDLEKELEGEVFEPLKDISFFRQFRLHPELHAVTWPNGADFAPEFLYGKVLVPA